MLIPNKLKEEDVIGIIAPSGYIEEKDLKYINKSIVLMENLGYKIKFGKNVFSNSTGYGATAKEKAEDINNMFADKKVNMIWCAKGGANSNSTFDYIDFDIIKKNPKILCGFSDSASILNIITQKTGLITFYGATFKSITSWETNYAYTEIIKRFQDQKLELGKEDDIFIALKEGVAEGELVGGNLSLTKDLVDGKYKIDFTNKILCLEELGYESFPELVSNYLYNMKQNGVFEKIKGMWIGNYEHESNISIEKIVLDTLENEYDFPIIKSNNFGHTERKTVIPIGTKARIENGKIVLLENCVK